MATEPRFLSREERHQLYDDSIAHWGAVAQIDMLTEELGEAIVALMKYTKRKQTFENYDHMAEEFCDALYMLEEIIFLYDNDPHPDATVSFSAMVANWMAIKAARTRDRLDESIARRG